MTSKDDLTANHLPVKHSYAQGSSLTWLPPLPAGAHTEGGLVIDMPLNNIKEYLSSMLDFEHIAKDEDLLDHLMQSYQANDPNEASAQRPLGVKLQTTLEKSVIYEQLDHDTKLRIMQRLH